jgi:hypothetical protein
MEFRAKGKQSHSRELCNPLASPPSPDAARTASTIGTYRKDLPIRGKKNMKEKNNVESKTTASFAPPMLSRSHYLS